MSTNPAKSHTIVEIDHEIFSMVILLPLFQEGVLIFQLQLKCSQIKLAQAKSMLMLTDHLH